MSAAATAADCNRRGDGVYQGPEQPSSAKEVAESLLAWAKAHNLFSKVPIEEGLDPEEDMTYIGEFTPSFRAQAVEDILRKRSINLIGFSEAERKVVIFTNGKLNRTEQKLLPFHSKGFTFEYIQGGVAQVRGNPPPPQQPKPFYLHNSFYACGSSIFPAHCIGAGTLGLLAKDHQGELFGLSNNHVAGACNNAMPGLPILAPGPIDATEDACDPFTIGRHVRLLPINDGIPENIAIGDNCDVSVFRILDPARVSSMQGAAFDTPSVVKDPAPPMRVEKVGRTTGYTTGTVVAQSASPVSVQYVVNEYGVRKTVWFETVYIVQGDNSSAFSKPGDSGSLVVSKDSNGDRAAVGLVFAGNEQRGLSFVLPLPAILQKLGLSITAGHNV
jgi:hypothetical protein